MTRRKVRHGPPAFLLLKLANPMKKKKKKDKKDNGTSFRNSKILKLAKPTSEEVLYAGNLLTFPVARAEYVEPRPTIHLSAHPKKN